MTDEEWKELDKKIRLWEGWRQKKADEKPKDERRCSWATSGEVK